MTLLSSRVIIINEWKNINGFTDNEIKKYQEIIESTAHLILDFAQKGGFENTSGF